MTSSRGRLLCDIVPAPSTALKAYRDHFGVIGNFEPCKPSPRGITLYPLILDLDAKGQLQGFEIVGGSTIWKSAAVIALPATSISGNIAFRDPFDETPDVEVKLISSKGKEQLYIRLELDCQADRQVRLGASTSALLSNNEFCGLFISRFSLRR